MNILTVLGLRKFVYQCLFCWFCFTASCVILSRKIYNSGKVTSYNRNLCHIWSLITVAEDPNFPTAQSEADDGALGIPESPLQRKSGVQIRQATSGSSRDDSDDDELEGDMEIPGNTTDVKRARRLLLIFYFFCWSCSFLVHMVLWRSTNLYVISSWVHVLNLPIILQVKEKLVWKITAQETSICTSHSTLSQLIGVWSSVLFINSFQSKADIICMKNSTSSNCQGNQSNFIKNALIEWRKMWDWFSFTKVFIWELLFKKIYLRIELLK